MSIHENWMLDSIVSSISELSKKYSKDEVKDMILRILLHSHDQIDEQKKIRLNQYHKMHR